MLLFSWTVTDCVVGKVGVSRVVPLPRTWIDVPPGRPFVFKVKFRTPSGVPKLSLYAQPSGFARQHGELLQISPAGMRSLETSVALSYTQNMYAVDVAGLPNSDKSVASPCVYFQVSLSLVFGN